MAACVALIAPPSRRACGGGFKSDQQGRRPPYFDREPRSPPADPRPARSKVRTYPLTDKVTFKMTSYDGFLDPANPDARRLALQTGVARRQPIRPATLTMAAGRSPGGRQAQRDLLAGKPPPGALYGVGESFDLTLPTGIISRRPKPDRRLSLALPTCSSPPAPASSAPRRKGQPGEERRFTDFRHASPPPPTRMLYGPSRRRQLYAGGYAQICTSSEDGRVSIRSPVKR
jgi:hypothetical protein